MVLLDLQDLEPDQHINEDPGGGASFVSLLLCDSAVSIQVCL
ncbi:SapB/AmfS family lanthipeptide [Streptomyces sp. 769]|nr:SapB/AmfS family lanthipeptide [Streptomyces sp. 769]AJC60936.1 hypothetical protein GZL_08408 [Streptomyces sp. 769]